AVREPRRRPHRALRCARLLADPRPGERVPLRRATARAAPDTGGGVARRGEPPRRAGGDPEPRGSRLFLSRSRSLEAAPGLAPDPLLVHGHASSLRRRRASAAIG